MQALDANSVLVQPPRGSTGTTNSGPPSRAVDVPVLQDSQSKRNRTRSNDLSSQTDEGPRNRTKRKQPKERTNMRQHDPQSVKRVKALNAMIALWRRHEGVQSLPVNFRPFDVRPPFDMSMCSPVEYPATLYQIQSRYAYEDRQSEAKNFLMLAIELTFGPHTLEEAKIGASALKYYYNMSLAEAKLYFEAWHIFDRKPVSTPFSPEALRSAKLSKKSEMWSANVSQAGQIRRSPAVWHEN